MKENQFYKVLYYFLVCVFILSGVGLGLIDFFQGKHAALYMGIGIIVFFIIPLVLRKLKIKLPYRLWSFIMIFLILGYNIGFVFDGYNKYMHFDKGVHFLSGILNCIFGLILFLYLNKKYKANWVSAVLFSLFFAIFIAVIGEFIECTVYLTTGYDCQHTETTGVFDTMGDLAFSFVSSLVVSMYYYNIGKRHSLFEKSIIAEFCKLNFIE